MLRYTAGGSVYAFHVLLDVCKYDVLMCFDVFSVFVVVECSLFCLGVAYDDGVWMWDIVIYVWLVMLGASSVCVYIGSICFLMQVLNVNVKSPPNYNE